MKRLPHERAHRQLSSKHDAGISLAELLMVVVILGVLTAVGVDTGFKEWRREQVNALTIELAGWLENVRRAALRGTSCTATITTGSISAGDLVATANGPTCLPNTPLRANPNNSAARYAISSTSQTITFTPRGTLSSSTLPITLMVNLAPDGPARCVSISGLLGLIRIGPGDAGHCGPDQRF
jgi:Tfp pilus assembly protein FimT